MQISIKMLEYKVVIYYSSQTLVLVAIYAVESSFAFAVPWKIIHSFFYQKKIRFIVIELCCKGVQSRWIEWYLSKYTAHAKRKQRKAKQ